MEREYWWDIAFSPLGMLSLQINLGVCDQGNLLAVINHKTFFKRERWRHQGMVAVSMFDLNIVFQQYLSCAHMCMTSSAVFTSPAQCPVHAHCFSFLAGHSPGFS